MAVVDIGLLKSQGLRDRPTAVELLLAEKDLAVGIFPFAVAVAAGKEHLLEVGAEGARTLVGRRVNGRFEAGHRLVVEVDYKQIAEVSSGPVVGREDQLTIAVGDRRIIRTATVECGQLHLVFGIFDLFPAQSHLTGIHFAAELVWASDFEAQVLEGLAGLFIFFCLLQRIGILSQGVESVLIIVGDLVPVDGRLALVQVLVGFAQHEGDFAFFHPAFRLSVLLFQHVNSHRILLSVESCGTILDLHRIGTSRQGKDEA